MEHRPERGQGSVTADRRHADGTTARVRRLAFAGAVLVAMALRFPLLDAVPNGLWCDEAATGYDAYSLLETGRNQHGVRLPIFTRAYGDWNEAMYRYLVVPSVAVFGLDERAVRFPAAVVGVVIVVLGGLVARRLWGPWEGVLAAWALALSPWNLHFSRAAFRGILLPAFLLAALLAVLAARRRPRAYLVAGLLFGLALWTYASARAFVPLFALGLLLIEWDSVREHPRWAAAGVAVFLAFVAAFLPHWLSPEGLARARQTANQPVWAWPLNYLRYFDPRFLFVDGDPSELYSAPGVGELLWFDALLVPAGLWALWRRDPPRTRRILLLWLVLYPLPAFLTKSPHALRSIAGSPVFALLSARGFTALLSAARPRLRPVAAAALAAGTVVSAGVVTWRYFIDYPVRSATQWEYGVRQAFEAIEKIDPPCVVVSDNLFLSYMFILFYTKYPPAKYHEHSVYVQQGNWYATDIDIGRYHVKHIARTRMTAGRCLFLVRPYEVPWVKKAHLVRPIGGIRAPDGTPVFVLLDVRPKDHSPTGS